MTARPITIPASNPISNLRIIWRYALSMGGPLSISVAHFLASLLILHALSPKDFGIFSFALIVMPLCLSASGALLVVSLTGATANFKISRDEAFEAHLKANLLFSTGATIVSGALALGSGADAGVAALLGLYSGAMCLRWFARAAAFIANNPSRVALSDLCYSLSLLGGLGLFVGLHGMTITHAALVMFASAILATASFGPEYLKKQFLVALTAPLQSYVAQWRDLTRWSLLGVLLTEITANAHAYLVTFISGPRSFALLAVGALFMRPVSLCLSALPDVERPFMARSIANGNLAKAERCVREFRVMGSATWVATGLLCVAVLNWFPSLVLKQDYRLTDVTTVVALWSAIMVMRLLRTPESVLLQAAGEFQVLARTTYLSSAISIVLTLALLLSCGPILSLIGILAGDGVMTAQTLWVARKWKRAHG